MFIAFEGADGAGKSTLAPLVASRLDHHDVVFRSKSHTVDPTCPAAERMAGLKRMLWPQGGIPGFLDYPASYWVMLQGAWYTLASRFTVEPLLDRGKTVVVDGWCYKFMAKASLDAIHPDLLESVFADVLVPDLVVRLDVDLSTVYERDSRFTFHELGGYQRYESRGRDSFVDHQTRVQNQLRRLVPQDRLLEVRLDATAGAAENVSAVLAAMKEHLAVTR